ncbi:MAG: DinB family protein [Candidatus Kapaibacterium sp.]
MVAIEHFRIARGLVKKLVDGLSEEQLFAVPQGYANNIAWNAAHVVVTQQLILYKLSGLELHVSEEVVESFRKGTGLEKITPKLFWEGMDFLVEAPEQLSKDYEKGVFESFERYETSTGIVLHNIDEAILFNNYHEGIHLGYMMAMRKSV